MPDPSQQIAFLHEKARQLRKANYTDEAIARELVKEGITESYAHMIIGNIDGEASDKKSFRNSLIMGSFYILAGLLLTWFSYNSNMSVYFIFWGLVVFGIVTIIRGVMLYR